jgi:hypothetical protein
MVRSRALPVLRVRAEWLYCGWSGHFVTGLTVEAGLCHRRHTRSGNRPVEALVDCMQKAKLPRQLRLGTPQERNEQMIFTRRFGALAARREFPHVDETNQEPVVDVASAEAELETELVKVNSAA